MEKINKLIKKDFIVILQDNDFLNSLKLRDFHKILSRKNVIIKRGKVNGFYQIGYYASKEIQL